MVKFAFCNDYSNLIYQVDTAAPNNLAIPIRNTINKDANYSESSIYSLARTADGEFMILNGFEWQVQKTVNSQINSTIYQLPMWDGQLPQPPFCGPPFFIRIVRVRQLPGESRVYFSIIDTSQDQEGDVPF